MTTIGKQSNIRINIIIKQPLKRFNKKEKNLSNRKKKKIKWRIEIEIKLIKSKIKQQDKWIYLGYLLLRQSQSV